MTRPITLIREARPEPKLNATPWKRIEGTNPQTVTIVNYQSPDGKKMAGQWICTPGKWEIEYAMDFRASFQCAVRTVSVFANMPDGIPNRILPRTVAL